MALFVYQLKAVAMETGDNNPQGGERGAWKVRERTGTLLFFYKGNITVKKQNQDFYCLKKSFRFYGWFKGSVTARICRDIRKNTVTCPDGAVWEFLYMKTYYCDHGESAKGAPYPRSSAG